MKHLNQWFVVVSRDTEDNIMTKTICGDFIRASAVMLKTALKIPMADAIDLLRQENVTIPIHNNLQNYGRHQISHGNVEVHLLLIPARDVSEQFEEQDNVPDFSILPKEKTPEENKKDFYDKFNLLLDGYKEYNEELKQDLFFNKGCDRFIKAITEYVFAEDNYHLNNSYDVSVDNEVVSLPALKVNDLNENISYLSMIKQIILTEPLCYIKEKNILEIRINDFVERCENKELAIEIKSCYESFLICPKQTAEKIVRYSAAVLTDLMD